MRKLTLLMTGWHFTGIDGEKAAVNLPHTWNSTDGQDGGNDYRRGCRQYDNTFSAPDFDRETQRVYLQFDGANASATVKINEREVISHHGGYSTFRTDITDCLQAENTISVAVDNSVNSRVYPQKADFTFYGGIYRDVQLVVVNRMHFDMDYHFGPGIKYTTQVNGTDAVVNVDTYINDEAKEQGAQIKVVLADRQGNTVAMADGTSVQLPVKNVRLWDGVKDPYLYRITAVLVKDGQAVDEISCNCGVRYFHFSEKDGFYLNGRRYPLHGVSRHQDWKNLGNALSTDYMDTDMALIKEVGANTIRLAHYQHSQYFYDLCDKEGMVVWAEIPYISEHMPDGRENTISQMKELIVQNFNHPSIVMWGVSNEITISGRQHKADMLDNHRVLNDLCHEMDPTRPTTLACYAMCTPFNPVSRITDLVGWNLYLGWYVPFLWLNDLWVKFYKWKYPQQKLCFSEYGAEGMPNLHSGKPRRGDHTEEYQAIYHVYMLKFFDRNPQIWANYVWNMFDFAADARDQGGERGMNHKGLVTFDRKTKKDSFYLYKCWWNSEPMVHLAGKRYEYRTEDTTQITVYSNQPQVSLYNNGSLIATQQGDKIFKFSLKLDAENHIEVKAGDICDSAVIYKTDTAKLEYRVRKGKSRNWV